MSKGTRQPSHQKRPGQRAEGRTAANTGNPAVGDTNPQVLAAREVKREARMQRQAEVRAVAERRRKMVLFRRVGIIAALAIIILGGGLVAYLGEANKPGEGVGQEPSPHIASVSDPHSYSTDPPTSGPHLRNMAPWGVTGTPVPKENEVHNLEDGGVIIHYRPDLDKATVDRLAAIARSYDNYLLMSPYPGLAQPIVLTAWNRIERMNTFDDARIKRFIDAYRGKDHHAESGG